MRFFDWLFGRTRLTRPKSEPLFQLITAQVDLETALGWLSAGAAALCLKPMHTVEFMETKKELQSLLQLVLAESGTELRVEHDDYGYLWLIFKDEDFEDLVGVTHIATQELQEKGYGEQMLAAVFRFSGPGISAPHYLIYSYKRGAFYPFIPLPGKKRDHPRELRASSLLPKYLPLEADQSRWYPLWDCPT
ncbi:MAG: PspA-associated protein PspAB [Limnochordia bacterium]|jgi:hypothetical protein